MKISELKQLIKEEIQNEIQVKRSGYMVNSSEYKKFYQLIDLSTYWGVDESINSEGEIHFNPLNDFYFFDMLWSCAQKQNWTPNYCLLTNDDFETMVYDYNLNDDEVAQVKNKFTEHSKQ